MQETNGYIIEWLKKLELERTFIITCIADDTGAGHFLTPIKNRQKLAKEMYELCPDIID